MDAIAGMAALEELNIGYTGVGDTGVASLGQLTSLRVLNMDSCDITDGCDLHPHPTWALQHRRSCCRVWHHDLLPGTMIFSLPSYASVWSWDCSPVL